MFATSLAFSETKQVGVDTVKVHELRNKKWNLKEAYERSERLRSLVTVQSSWSLQSKSKVDFQTAHSRFTITFCDDMMMQSGIKRNSFAATPAMKIHWSDPTIETLQFLYTLITSTLGFFMERVVSKHFSANQKLLAKIPQNRLDDKENLDKLLQDRLVFTTTSA